MQKNYFFKYFPSAKLSCTDVSEKSLNIAQERYPDGAEYKIFDGIALPYESESFNIVFTACVFHHIPLNEHDALFKEILRVLKKDGVFIIFEHNPLNPLTVRAVNTCEFDKNAELIRCNRLRNQLRRAGFNQVAHKYRIFFPRFLKVLRFFESRLGWLPLGAQYYVTGRK
jgi:ubiquinone/menaquinone biosynthesis C-methylase UbiE